MKNTEEMTYMKEATDVTVKLVEMAYENIKEKIIDPVPGKDSKYEAGARAALSWSLKNILLNTFEFKKRTPQIECF